MSEKGTILSLVILCLTGIALACIGRTCSVESDRYHCMREKGEVCK